MIVATAGHVDHGKTSLIRQLTGVDTDRLEEEKRRGLSINLGYAYLPTEGGIPIGFIDVPGHQRFINTMISGISGIDLGMLVIAADDGVMPQTQEHLDVLSVLGVKRLVVVISKIDRVEPERVEDVTAVAANLVQAHHFETLGVFPLDNISGEGIAPLRQFLCSSAQENVAKAPTGCFRLSVDRAFTIKGSGLVVTGTTSTGAVSEGDTLTHFPTGNEVRVRSLRVHDAQAAAAAPGQRCAINLTGDIALSDVERGDWLLGHGCGQATAVIDAEATLLSDAPFSLKHLSPVKIHIGAQRVAGRIALPFSGDEKRMQPGKTRLVQLRLEEPIPTYT
ncbi:MAG: selenocysteine-specific translation elongation factor, partial [Halioglobus sp.]